MCRFLQQHASAVIGMLNGWDRLRIRGTLRSISHAAGLSRFLSYSGKLLKGFGEYALSSSRQVRAAALEVAKRRRSGQITRRLRILRAHGLIHKLPHTHRYVVSDNGRQVIAALMAAREADINKLTQAV